VGIKVGLVVVVAYAIRTIGTYENIMRETDEKRTVNGRERGRWRSKGNRLSGFGMKLQSRGKEGGRGSRRRRRRRRR
jgi:hypothetical protein